MEVETLKTDPFPLLMIPEAVPMMHCDALIELANDEKLWVAASSSDGFEEPVVRQLIWKFKSLVLLEIMKSDGNLHQAIETVAICCY